MLPDKKEIESLVQEKKSLNGALSKYSSEDFKTLLSLCNDLADIIADFEELNAKKDKVKHAALATKIKFSRKVRRKGKDVGKFERALVSEFDAKRISLEHGRRMADVIKILRKGEIEKAGKAAEGYYAILELGRKKEENDLAMAQKREQIGKEKGRLRNQLSRIEALEREPRLDEKKIERHKLRGELMQSLQKVRLEEISKIKSLPLPQLLKMAREDSLAALGFPEIPPADADALVSSLQKLNLSPKAAQGLAQMCDWNESRLRHGMAEPAAFKRQIVPHRAWLEQIAMLENSYFLQMGHGNANAMAYLSQHSSQAADAFVQISELEKTAPEDEAEYLRAGRIAGEKAELAGITKEKIAAHLKEAEELEAIISGSALAAHSAAAGKEASKNPNGILSAIFSFFIKPK